MSPNPTDSEAAIELATIQHFEALDWETINAENEVDGDSTLLGRQHQGEVVLVRHLHPVLVKLNPTLSIDAIDQAIEVLTRDRSVMNIVQANQDVYRLLKAGIQVTYRDQDGNDRIERVKVIDWNNPENNHFLLVSQLWINGDPYRKRPDLVGFINGIPLLFVELKAPDVGIYHAFNDNFRDYKSTIPQLFWYNAVVILSNGNEAKVGSVTAPWEHFNDWKKIDDESEPGLISLDTVIRAVCTKNRIIDLAENFTIFEEGAGGLQKLVAKNHQFLGVNNAIGAIQRLGKNKGRLGVFWHTQGSGKSASMIFFSQKVLRKIPGNWTFVIVTDRQELDNQIYETFQKAGVITEDQVQANSSNHLRQLLSEDHRFVFTLIHKFRTENGERHPVLSNRSDIIVITDEAHRSQYATLAQNMRNALPEAAFLGFTGTPLIKGEEERTREVFGDYVSIYNFRQSIEDKATVPLYYENRIPELQLTAFGKEHLNDDMYRIIDEAMLDQDQEKKLEREFSRMYQLITRDDRLEKIAFDLVEHFMGRGHLGKAMVVAIDKATVVKMYDKVQKYWQVKINNLLRAIHKMHGDDLIALKEQIEFMEATDMAVVVSSGQNEIDDLRKKGVEILPHRKRMVKEELDIKFKDPNDPFRIVFVCAMWMTGFDVPSCSTIYLDKPMRNHTLMQTIARANRVYGDEKKNGLIVDYVGVFRSLEKALAIYADPGDDSVDPPIRDKDELKNELIQAIQAVKDFVRPLGVDLESIRQTKDVFQRTYLKSEAVDLILVNDDTKSHFLHLADAVHTIYKALLPNPVDTEIAETAYLIHKIANQISTTVEPANISEVLYKVERLMDDSIEGYSISEPLDGSHIYDLSRIDFEKLRQQFEKGRKRTKIAHLRRSIEDKLNILIAINRSRMNFMEQYQQIINEYNSGAHSVDVIFRKLVELANTLKDEETRHIREELGSEQELAVFDLLTKPDMHLSKKEIKQVKAVARDLLIILTTEKLVLDWKKKQETRAKVKLTIEEILDQLPSTYSTQLFQQKCESVYHYIYDMGGT